MLYSFLRTLRASLAQARDENQFALRHSSRSRPLSIPPSKMEEAGGARRDRFDDDGDGLVDSSDNGCKNREDDSERTERCP